jgi:hypothetical protein
MTLDDLAGVGSNQRLSSVFPDPRLAAAAGHLRSPPPR